MSDIAPSADLPVKRNKSRKKTLVLVRHAQSNENVKVIKMFEGLTRLRNFQAPSFQHIRSTLSLSSLTINSLVSPLGKRQILDMHMILRDENFWAHQNFDLVVCSPLTRARETCEGIFPTEPGGLKILIRDDLEEATPYEHICNGTLLARIERFKHWLAGCDEERILIVGHSQYFKKMLGLTSLMRNCDVWQCDFASDEGNRTTDKMTFEYTNLNLLYRTNLSEMHPYDKMINTNKKDKIESKVGDEVDNDLHDDEPVCRICQVSQPCFSSFCYFLSPLCLLFMFSGLYFLNLRVLLGHE
jgi:phosphohistidine phosphatase SixA